MELSSPKVTLPLTFPSGGHSPLEGDRGKHPVRAGSVDGRQEAGGDHQPRGAVGVARLHLKAREALL